MDKKRLRIAFLSRYVGKVDRGVETFVLEVSNRLKVNYDVEILTGANADSFKKIISGNYDIVIPTNGRLQALKVSLGRLFSHYKIVISAQAGIGRDDLWNILIARPNAFVTLTNFGFSWAKKWATNINIVKIPNGVDLEKFTSKGEKLALDLPKPVILSVGALEWYKHHEKVIKALALLDQGSLLIVGQGPKLSELKSLGEELLLGRFKIMSVPYKEIPQLYRSVELFTLPSWEREAFGIVYLEAMSANVPVVAPNDESRQEIIGEGGILVDVDDSQQYANAIKQALSKKWGTQPRMQAEKFSWDHVTQQYEKLFKELVQ